MKLKLLFTFITLAFAITNAEYKNYKGHKLYKIVPKTENDVEIVKNLETNGIYQFWNYGINKGQDVKIMVAPEDQLTFEARLGNIEGEVKVITEDVQNLIDAQLRRPNINRLSGNYAWEYYQTYEEINQWMDDIVAEHSDVAEIVTIGNSIEGRPIRGVVIDYHKREQKVIGILEGGLHAREWITPATMTYAIHAFLTSEDPEIRALAENIVWHIFPVVNPDGYVYTFTGNRMWRKNRNNVSFTSCAQWGVSDDMSHGVDLNRNFGFRWMTIGASNNPCAETYAGPSANSELETISIINYVQGLQNNENNHVLYFFGFHSFTQLLLVPFSDAAGSDVMTVPNYSDMYEIAIRGADALQRRYNTQYTVGTSGDILYNVSGSSVDWAKGVAEIPIVLLFELRDNGDYGFLLPPEQIIENNEEIMDALVEMDKVTRQIGYYQSSHGIIFIFNMVLFVVSLFIVM